MLKKLIEKFQKEGKIKKQRVGLIQLEALLKEAILDLREAKKVLNIGERNWSQFVTGLDLLSIQQTNSKTVQNR